MGAREEIMATAERLFAARGIETMSLREITRESGQRNVMALQYHFGDRDGLLLAIVERHLTGLGARLHARLDLLPSDGTASAAEVVGCLVDAMTGAVPEAGGSEFLQIAGQLLHRTTAVPGGDDPSHLLVDDPAGSLRRWADALTPHLHPAVTGAPLHQRFSVMRFAYLELARRVNDPERRPPGELFASHLVDLLVALALATPSERTLAALSERSI